MHEYERTGVISLDDLSVPTQKQLEKGVAIIECIQHIPCNPCVESCPVHAISMEDVNALPEIDYDVCIACGQCIGICPGLAIFVAKIVGEKVHLSLPYEFHPIPRVGDRVVALDRSGNAMDDALVKRVVKKGKTMVVTIEIAKDLAMVVRNIRV